MRSSHWNFQSKDMGRLRALPEHETQRIHLRNDDWTCRNPCTSIAVRGDIAVAGYSSGHIRLFNVRTGKMVVEIDAHSRCINAIELHPSEPSVSAPVERYAIFF
jgi:WD40 repeat protein